MFRFLKSFLGDSPTAAMDEVTTTDAPHFDGMSFESLWEDFERRTYQYSHIKDRVKAVDLRLLNWIGSMDGSGRVRETCLRNLIAETGPGDENRILLRLSDWVPEIRSIARDWVMTNIRQLPLESIRANQRLILYLSRKERVQSDSAMEFIENDLLARTQGIDIGRFHDFEPAFRKFILSLSLGRDQKLRSWVLLDKDPFNRLLLLTHLGIDALTQEEIRKYSSDRSVHVRRDFAQRMVARDVLLPREFLMELAFDPGQGVRQLARFYLMRFHEVDMYPVYRSHSNTAFYYIADFARKEDVPIFMEGCRNKSKRIRIACLRALVAAEPERIKDLDLTDLIQSARQTRRLVCRLAPRILDLTELMGLKPAVEQSSANGQLTFLRMIEIKSFWTFLDLGLDCMDADPTTAVRRLVTERVWARVSINEKPSASLRESIACKVERMRSSRIDAHLAEQIAFMLKHA